MSFQFQCPQGHLLEAEDWQAGQACQCPMCGAHFMIPGPAAPSAPPAAVPPPAPPGPPPAGGPPSSPPAAGSPFSQPAAEPAPSISVGDAASPEQPKLYHIPCPNGHELESPADMLGQDVLCPECQVQFQLRERDSVEYKQKRALAEQRRERKVGDAWFNLAVVTAVIVVLGLVALIAATWLS